MVTGVIFYVMNSTLTSRGFGSGCEGIAHVIAPEAATRSSTTTSLATNCLSSMLYLLAVNCGSSSIKGKLYDIPELTTQANLSVSNISSKGEKVKIKVEWVDGRNGSPLEEEGEDGASVKCTLYRFASIYLLT
jgi:hypothetical protein